MGWNTVTKQEACTPNGHPKPQRPVFCPNPSGLHPAPQTPCGVQPMPTLTHLPCTCTTWCRQSSLACKLLPSTGWSYTTAIH